MDENVKRGGFATKMLIIIAVILAVLSIGFFVWHYFADSSKTSSESAENTATETIAEETEEVKNAKEVAYDKFVELGERDLDKSKFQVVDINKNGVKSYYISSAQNSIEVRESDLKILRVNGVLED